MPRISTRISIVGRGTLDGNGAAYKDRRPRRPPPADPAGHQLPRRAGRKHPDAELRLLEPALSGLRARAGAAACGSATTPPTTSTASTSTAAAISSSPTASSTATTTRVCLKSTSDRPCENVLISNCVISSHCNAIKMGTDSSGGFVNVAITNCSIVSPRDSKVIYGLQRGISGISLELVDGGKIDRVAVSNVTIDGVETPIFVRLGNRGTGLRSRTQSPKKQVPVGTLRNVSFANIVATRAGKTGCSIVGLPGHRHRKRVAQQRDHPQRRRRKTRVGVGHRSRSIAEGYPEATMFGKLPAHGLYCRHVRGLTLSDVRL